MENKGGLGARRKPTKRRRSRGFAKAVKDYLFSDSYMYAALIDSPPTDSTLTPDVRSPRTAGEIPFLDFLGFLLLSTTLTWVSRGFSGIKFQTTKVIF